MPAHKYFSSDVIFNQNFENIDSDKGIISGVKICSEGVAEGHGVYLNKKFIREVTRHGKDHEVGVKARFGHPNMCATSLGTYLGRYKNFRTQTEERPDWEDGKRYHSIADLHLDETSKSLPKLGNAWEYIMKLAQTSPNMFGNSIVFTPGESEYKKEKDSEGNERIVREDATIEKLHATDLVDEPAATEGLFERFEENDLAMQVTTFLDQHPEVYKLAINNPDILETFLNKYESYKKRNIKTEDVDMDNKTLFENLKTFVAELFTKKEEGKDDILEIPKEVTDKITEFETSLTALAAENISLKAEFESLKVANDNLKADKEAELTALNAKISGLETDLVKANAQSTKISGLEGKEDTEMKKDPEAAMWDAEAQKIKDEFKERTDESPDLDAKLKTVL